MSLSNKARLTNLKYLLWSSLVHIIPSEIVFQYFSYRAKYPLTKMPHATDSDITGEIYSYLEEEFS